MRICFVPIFLFLTSFSVFADTIKVSVAIIPSRSDSLTAPIPAALSSILKAAGVKFQLELYPFKRSIYNAIKGNHDFHFPIIESPFAKKIKLKYELSNTTFWKLPFVLYTRADKPPINIELISDYKILTDGAHQALFDFPTTAVFDLTSAIRMIDRGRADGFIFAENSIDPIIRRLKLSNIRRTLFGMFKVKAVFKLGNKNGMVDKALQEGINNLKAYGKYKAIAGQWNNEYTDWQPYIIFSQEN
ncbi:MAG: hypothetical protein MJK10_01430 [Pseudomonadales bacterium]|nr:hypothetical protein [Pseudomonadales bacterium]NRA14533.1 hypothetical protein [Oceanospirillaceae bacterium]